MKKGITPVVALILLLLITIAVVGFASGFFQRVFSTSSEQAQEEIKKFSETSGQTFRIENAKGTSVTIRSTGSADIRGSSLSVYIDDVPVSPACTWSPDPVPSGGTSTCTLPSACGSGKTIRVVGAAADDSVPCS